MRAGGVEKFEEEKFKELWHTGLVRIGHAEALPLSFLLFHKAKVHVVRHQWQHTCTCIFRLPITEGGNTLGGKLARVEITRESMT